MLHLNSTAPARFRPRRAHRGRSAFGSALAPVGRYLSRQAALPQWAFGRLLGWRWISETAAVNDITLEILKPAPGERICEIGFGPGGTLALLAAAGAEAIADGRVELHRGDGVKIPFPDDHLDAALAACNVYFWPDPAATLADLARTLRPVADSS